MEIEPVSRNPYNELLKLSETEKNDLAARIAEWEGTVRLFVHPSFYEANHHPKALNIKEFEGHAEVSATVKRMLKKPEVATPPIIIMEEHSHLAKSFDELNGESAQSAYFIETEDSDPAPYQLDDGFEKLADFFADLGVKKNIIGGQVMWIDTNELQDAGNVDIPKEYGYEDQMPWVGGCAGEAINKLNDDRFKIEISNISFPDKPIKMRLGA